MCTFRKQWTYFEMLKGVDDDFTKHFAVITPKKVYREICFLIIIVINLMLVLLAIFTYYVYNFALGISSWLVCLSYYLSGLQYSSIVAIFYFSTNTILRRFHHVNSLLRQLAAHDLPKNTFELCSRTSKNDQHTPTIALTEIYSIYGSHLKKNLPHSPPVKNFKSRDEVGREIRKLTSKLENREQNFWKRMKNRNLIHVEEFKLAKMKNVDDIIEHLTKLLDIHDVLLDCISLQNEILSFQILTIVAQIFVYQVVALFSLYRTLYNTSAASNVLALTNIFWLTIYNGTLFAIMSISSQCVTEGKFTGTCVHKVMNKIASYADPRVIEKVRALIDKNKFHLSFFIFEAFNYVTSVDHANSKNNLWTFCFRLGSKNYIF